MQVRHGDLKSKNVLLTKGAEVAKLSDVGMARILTTTQSIAEVSMCRACRHAQGQGRYQVSGPPASQLHTATVNA